MSPPGHVCAVPGADNGGKGGGVSSKWRDGDAGTLDAELSPGPVRREIKHRGKINADVEGRVVGHGKGSRPRRKTRSRLVGRFQAKGGRRLPVQNSVSREKCHANPPRAGPVVDVTLGIEVAVEVAAPLPPGRFTSPTAGKISITTGGLRLGLQVPGGSVFNGRGKPVSWTEGAEFTVKEAGGCKQAVESPSFAS